MIAGPHAGRKTNFPSARLTAITIEGGMPAKAILCKKKKSRWRAESISSQRESPLTPTPTVRLRITSPHSHRHLAPDPNPATVWFQRVCRLDLKRRKSWSAASEVFRDAPPYISHYWIRTLCIVQERTRVARSRLGTEGIRPLGNLRSDACYSSGISKREARWMF
ncbi:hypothetical protein J437_LFUL013552 [Ladona fulva]|uniref:Heterokaryon incompatibility domain-containing protein n=1 Tax=Ladona fulva TaxID=123851 RepID=A0A8K0KE84_LADFU|nr:hypothetical protein J437_LFUL013552 [Ladona fulva]